MFTVVTFRGLQSRHKNDFKFHEHPQTGAHILVAPNMVLRASTNEKTETRFIFHQEEHSCPAQVKHHDQS